MGFRPAICHIRKNGYYHLFVSFDFCGIPVNFRGEGHKPLYKIMVGRSRKITGPFEDRSGKPMLEGGGTLLLTSQAHVRGPGHNSILMDHDKDWLVHHFYDANSQGTPTQQIRPLLWNDNWPLAGEPISPPLVAPPHP